MERKAREDAEREARAAAARRAEEEAARRREEEAARGHREAEERAAAAAREAEAKKQVEVQRREEERRRSAAAQASGSAGTARGEPGKSKPRPTDDEDDIRVGDHDIDMDEVLSDRQRLVKAAAARPAAQHSDDELIGSDSPRRWGKPVALGLFVLLLAVVGGLHFVPISPEPYANQLARALGVPVKVSGGRLSLITGLQVKFDTVTIGEGITLTDLRVHPELGALFSEQKRISRVEVREATLPQAQLGPALLRQAQGDSMGPMTIHIRELRLPGALALPVLDAVATLDRSGSFAAITLKGADQLVVKLAPDGEQVKIELNAARLAPPMLPDLSLSSVGLKGSITSGGAEIESWDATLLDGTLAGKARLRWSTGWTLEGGISAKGINAVVFAPTLLSEGKADAKGSFSMSAADPTRLAQSLRLDGSFTVSRGVLGSFDFARAIQTGGAQAQGRTVFNELSAQGSYDRGAVALRNINIASGGMNASASLDIARDGALRGRVVADVKAASQTLRSALELGGTVANPQVRK